MLFWPKILGERANPTCAVVHFSIYNKAYLCQQRKRDYGGAGATVRVSQPRRRVPQCGGHNCGRAPAVVAPEPAPENRAVFASTFKAWLWRRALRSS